jgi:hypothetical protein
MAEVAITTTNTATKDGTAVGVEDVLAVRSRVSWPAILGGSILAVAFYFLLTLIGGAIGLSVSDKVDAKTIGTGAAVYAIVVTALCLFAGGFLASQFTAGENKQEGALYGLLVWAAVTAMLLWLMASGVKAGFSALVGVATTGTAVADLTARNTTQEDWEAVARRAGYTQEQINEFKAKAQAAPADAREAAEDPATRAKAEQLARETAEVSARVAWWAAAGVMLSMAAAAGGGFLGAGPSFRLFTVPVARTVAQRRILTP